jgi:hypothetical protein
MLVLQLALFMQLLRNIVLQNTIGFTKSFGKITQVILYLLLQQVQSGGSFDIDYFVEGPTGKVILNGERERQGDYVFTANEVGEYSFCFSNDMSTFAEKLVDFEITVEHEARPSYQMGGSPVQPPETLSFMEESLFRLSGSLSNIARTQKYFRTRENRNFSTVVSTEKRIFWFAATEGIAIIAMAGLQVFVVRNFFNVKKGGV